MRLDDKVAVVTGATSGFGLAIARRFAAEGAALILNARDDPAGARLVDELSDTGSVASFVAGDVGEPETGRAIAARAREAHGRIDALILNAGIGTIGIGPFWEIAIDDFDAIFRTNVRGVWLCARAAAPLLGRGASVVVMGSMSSFIVYPDETVYSASKGALVQLARGMAGDLAERGVRVNTLCPGICDTPLTRHFIDSAADPAEMERGFAAVAPLGRMGTAAEVAAAALYFASDESSYTTGASLIVDGGVTIR
jgi:NAD(P)-dependent dehydrogenase (short-subunit alcohol dehydrogenase family)